MHRSDVLRRVARTYPAVCRPPMRLVASSRLSCHWLVNALLRDLGIYDSTPAYVESLDLYVPRPLVDAYQRHEPLTRQDIEEKFTLNVAHGGWDKARADRFLAFARTAFDKPIDLSPFRG